MSLPAVQETQQCAQTGTAMMHRRQPKIYATLRRRFCREALTRMGFQRTSSSGSALVKLGAMRTPYATASPDGEFWRVTPLVSPRVWRPR
jgi:uncharacterized protein (DUF169 family)